MFSSTLSLTSALDVGGWSTPRSGRFNSEKDPVPIVQEAWWAPRPVWTVVENLAATDIRSPDSPSRSESLYRLSYSGPLTSCSTLNVIDQVSHPYKTTSIDTVGYITVFAVSDTKRQGRRFCTDGSGQSVTVNCSQPLQT